ncbi:hypothetical protein PR048_009783 [Dryococelus australis]|uniref:Uncharacterized protein n=1 Tax=Dryococelus australis TaxID=614101 RepID=A0ABQ9I1X1_9NEOP|nr:hypothetical protein PR048_009783 [Dryococelus australis]
MSSDRSEQWKGILRLPVSSSEACDWQARILDYMRAAVAQRLARSPLTKANRAQSSAGSPDFRKWESWRTIPLVGGSSRRSSISPAPSFRRRSIFTSITLISSQDLAVKSRPNLFTHSWRYKFRPLPVFSPLLWQTRCCWAPTSIRATRCHSITDEMRGIRGAARLYIRGSQSVGHLYPSPHSGSLTAQGAAGADRLRAPTMRDDNARGEDPPRGDAETPSPRRGLERPANIIAQRSRVAKRRPVKQTCELQASSASSCRRAVRLPFPRCFHVSDIALRAPPCSVTSSPLLLRPALAVEEKNNATAKKPLQIHHTPTPDTIVWLRQVFGNGVTWRMVCTCKLPLRDDSAIRRYLRETPELLVFRFGQSTNQKGPIEERAAKEVTSRSEVCDCEYQGVRNAADSFDYWTRCKKPLCFSCFPPPPPPGWHTSERFQALSYTEERRTALLTQPSAVWWQLLATSSVSYTLAPSIRLSAIPAASLTVPSRVFACKCSSPAPASVQYFSSSCVGRPTIVHVYTTSYFRASACQMRFHVMLVLLKTIEKFHDKNFLLHISGELGRNNRLRGSTWMAVEAHEYILDDRHSFRQRNEAPLLNFIAHFTVNGLYGELSDQYATEGSTVC